MIFSLLLTVSALYTVSCTPQSPAAPGRCTRRFVRREIRDLSPPERNAFFNAIKRVNSGARPTVWDRFTQMHLQGQNIFHGCAMFLPWHRMMLRRMEQELQKVDPSVAMPYWDWSMDANQPQRSVIFTPSFFGGDSQGGCLRDGPFAGMQVQFPTPHCVARRFRPQGMGPFASPTVLGAIIARSPEYEDFRMTLESVPHSAPHIGVGGDLTQMQSPNDPIFYMHHGFIDKLWFDWQQQDPSREGEYYGTNRNGQRATLSDALPSVNAIVRDALSVRNLCYTYAAPRSGNRLLRRAVDVKTGDLKDAKKTTLKKKVNYEYTMSAGTTQIRLPKYSDEDAKCAAKLLKEEIVPQAPVPECWIKMNNYCEQTIRSIEKSLNCIIDQVNVEYRKLNPPPPPKEPDSAY